MINPIVRSKEKLSLGFDKGSAYIKSVKLNLLKDKTSLAGFNVLPFQSTSADAYKNILQSNGLKKINISLAGNSVAIRYIAFPRMDQEELKRSLKFEGQKYIPFNMQEVNIDTGILKNDLPENKMLVLLAAVKKDFISQKMSLFDSYGFAVNIATVEPVALMNAFLFNYSDDEKVRTKTVALLDIGAEHSSLNILESGIPYLSREINIAGNNFTQALAGVLGVDFPQAEKIKISQDKEKIEKAKTAIDTIMVNFSGEIRASFDYYESLNASAVNKIFLGGGGSLFPLIKAGLSEMLDIEVEHWDPFRKIEIPPETDKNALKSASSQLTVAVGLALES